MVGFSSILAGIGIASSLFGARSARRGSKIPPELQALYQANLELTQRSGPAFEAIRTSVGKDLTSFIQKTLRESRRGQRRTGISAIDPERTSEFKSAFRKQGPNLISDRIGRQIQLNNQTISGMGGLITKAQQKFDIRRDLFGGLSEAAFAGAGMFGGAGSSGAGDALQGYTPVGDRSGLARFFGSQWASGTSNRRSGRYR